MKAIIWDQYGPPEVLKMQDVPKPVPKEDEILVKIHATTVTAGDCELRGLKFILSIRLMLRLYFGFFRPRKKTLGQELSGEIIEIGANVSNFKIGDQIMATTGLTFGAYAEYICLKLKGGMGVVSLKPNNLSFEAAAGLPVGGMEALHFIREGHLEKNQKLLINGAGGSIGTAAIQIAKYIGAEVTAVDSKDKLEILKEAGADIVIDYKTVDFTKQDNQYDMIFDVVGKASYRGCLKRLSENGYYIIANPKVSLLLKGMITNISTKQHVVTRTTEQTSEDLTYLKELVEQNHLTVIIDRKYLLKDIVQAHKYVESGQKKGNLIITVIDKESGDESGHL